MNTNIMDVGIKLMGQTIDLVLLELEHKEELAAVLHDDAIWAFTWRKITTLEQAQALVDEALRERSGGSQLPFAVIEKSTGLIVGTTRIAAISQGHRHAEIGYSWLSPRVWRTSVNTECKRLLLGYCFEHLHMLRVQFSISHYNVRSQRAVERLGAVQEGVLRKARIKPDGTVHDVMLYSILASEWEVVKERLDGYLSHRSTSVPTIEA
ncbi:N-acetyltransferase [Paenibacillus sp. 1011MAR3C5]|uniref:GNAT family N-acetyltransferase n=1 Tax=Paenibacillus sp. 1011MAR3C5 TaxID=1675787 RepID=UPI000E6CBEFB|nr:GNAT family protein [Paenibacillus sp. 1011MAR3C5]RJE90422.1 N-acetyltransferase [Paenibacillus sp. 1011MAR3C5]